MGLTPHGAAGAAAAAGTAALAVLGINAGEIRDFAETVDKELANALARNPSILQDDAWGYATAMLPELLGDPAGLTLFEHKLPDYVSFPMILSDAVEGLVYPNGATPPYKDKEKYNVNAKANLLQCAKDERVSRNAQLSCSTVHVKPAVEIQQRLGEPLKARLDRGHVFADVENTERLIIVLPHYQSDDRMKMIANLACVAASKGVSPKLYDAFTSPSGPLYFVVEKFDGTLWSCMKKIGTSGTRNSTAKWEALDKSLLAFFDRMMKARVCHMDLTVDNVVTRETSHGINIWLMDWDNHFMSFCKRVTHSSA
jgi:hypothetical protein